MKSTVILPFEEKPYELSYHNLAFPMGVIQAWAKEDITPWLCGKFINPCFAPDSPSNKFAINFNDPWYRQDGILLMQTVDLLPKSYALLPYSRNEWMRRMLSLGWYVHGTFNEEYIPDKDGYQKYYYHHDYFIIGYTIQKEKVYLAEVLAAFEEQM